MKLETNKNQRLEGKLVASIKIEGLGDLIQEYAELGLDAVIDEGILRDIPIIGTLIKTTKVVGSVRDLIYLKKLINFLKKVGETTQEQREKFIDENCKDTKKFEESVLLILEQADNMNKSALIGKIFKACILGKFLYKDAIRLSEMVNRAFWDDLGCLLKDEEKHWQREKLFIAGFYDQDTTSYFGDSERKRTPLVLYCNYYTNAIKLIANEQYDKLDSLVNPIENGLSPIYDDFLDPERKTFRAN